MGEKFTHSTPISVSGDSGSRWASAVGVQLGSSSPRLQPTGKSGASPPPIRSPPRALGPTLSLWRARWSRSQERRRIGRPVWERVPPLPGPPVNASPRGGRGGNTRRRGDPSLGYVPSWNQLRTFPERAQPTVAQGCRAPARVRFRQPPGPDSRLCGWARTPVTRSGSRRVPASFRRGIAVQAQGEKAAPSLPLKHPTKNNQHGLPLPPPAPREKEGARLRDAGGPGLPRRSPPRRLQKNLQPVGAAGQVPTRRRPGRGRGSQGGGAKFLGAAGEEEKFAGCWPPPM